ncbi:MAG: hypothetical protein JWQ23_2865 [Herminiimonas sp.]|nr:hypothetical protein [Herminiimonas sp.]
MNLRNHAFSISLSLFALGSAATIAQPAYAQRAAATQITDFYVTPDNEFTPGTELTFTVEGTPRGKATVKIASRNILLKEVSPGMYEADYTVSRKDRLSARSTMRATLTARGKSTVMNEVLGGAASAPIAAAPVAPSPAAAPLAVQRFQVTPLNKIEPGAELKFTLSGTPGAKASFTIDGIVKDVAMQETGRGQYEGSYTIRRLDNFPPSLSIVGTLEANGQTVRQRLSQSIVADARPPVIRNIAPRNGDTIATNQVLVSGTFDDRGGLGVDTNSVRIIVAGNDVTRNATITPQFFSYRADLRPGTYQVEIIAKDLSGNGLRQAWSFNVAQQAAPVAAMLPLQVTSHANNAQVGSGAVEVRGRTAPDAKVDVQVQAIAQIAGHFGMNQQVFSQSLRSDANGNFGFSFHPPIPVPGTRYEIAMTASKANLTQENRLVLFQQR